LTENGVRGIDTNGFDIGIGASLSGVGTLVKQGAGVLTLKGNNSYAGGTASFFGDKAYDASTDFVLGKYGFDRSKGTVWAVLNHNSDFTVVSEPGTWGLIGAAALGALPMLSQRFRRRS